MLGEAAALRLWRWLATHPCSFPCPCQSKVGPCAFPGQLFPPHLLMVLNNNRVHHHHHPTTQPPQSKLLEEILQSNHRHSTGNTIWQLPGRKFLEPSSLPAITTNHPSPPRQQIQHFSRALQREAYKRDGGTASGSSVERVSYLRWSAESNKKY